MPEFNMPPGVSSSDIPGNSGPKYPKVKVRLTGQDGNVYNILGLVAGAMRKAKVPENEVKEFIREACSGDYAHTLMTCDDWVTIS